MKTSIKIQTLIPAVSFMLFASCGARPVVSNLKPIVSTVNAQSHLPLPTGELIEVDYNPANDGDDYSASRALVRYKTRQGQFKMVSYMDSQFMSGNVLTHSMSLSLFEGERSILVDSFFNIRANKSRLRDLAQELYLLQTSNSQDGQNLELVLKDIEGAIQTAQ